ncbi:hypothetical protein, partial [Microbacterium sp. 69-10]|uniref:hypothetical protein n=1 Tax=Microbacterium sp. 69-10 TaxID=1895783 RepID=UPI0025FE055F
MSADAERLARESAPAADQSADSVRAKRTSPREAPAAPGAVEIIEGDNLEAAGTLASGSFSLVY